MSDDEQARPGLAPDATTADYRNAPSGVGPLKHEWRNKLHRVVYDLCSELDRVKAERDALLAACDEALNVLIGCCVPAGGCDDRETILATQRMLRAVIGKAKESTDAAS